MQEPNKRALYEICKDMAKYPDLLQEREATQTMLSGSVRDVLISTWGGTIQENFDDALRFLKSQLLPCGDIFSVDIVTGKQIGRAHV